MEKGQGDLTDIFQGGGFADPAAASDVPSTITDDWKSSPDPAAGLSSASGGGFVDDFADTKDLMLHELAGTGFFGPMEKTEASKGVSSMAITVIRQPPPPPPPLAALADTPKVAAGGPTSSPRTTGIKRRFAREFKINVTKRSSLDISYHLWHSFQLYHL